MTAGVQIRVIRVEQLKINQQQRASQVSVWRTINCEESLVTLSSKDLVPGDLVELTQGEIVPADMVLIEGHCHLDEGILTGESVLVYKASPKPSTQHFSEAHHEHMVFMGTKCVASGGPSGRAVGLVLHTGFNTMRGSLIRALVFTDTGEFKYERDAGYFVSFLVVIATAFLVAYLWMTSDVSSESGWM